MATVETLKDTPACSNSIRPDEPTDTDSDRRLKQRPSEDQDDNDTLRATSFSTGINEFYVQDWRAKEAFRELYQNWKDAIIQSFGQNPRCFTPLWEDLASQIQITVRRQHVIPGNGQLLGYIRFDKTSGKLELVNFNARLSPQDFSLGASAKKGSESTAGYHGEGFKLAALVFRRLNYRVRISASSCTWNFNFRGTYHSNLYVRQSPANQKKIQKAQDAHAIKLSAGSPRDLRANIWEDVSVEISKGPGGEKIDTKDFLSWISVTLDLKGPSADNLIVKTNKGDLILEKAFAGRIYLKGLLLSDTNINSKPFRFGYNFVEGHVDRDRRRLRNSSEEADILASIWEEAIHKRGKDVLQPFINMFQDDPHCRDIREAQYRLTFSAAEAIWTHLVPFGEGGFYYNEKYGEKDSKLIQKCLKKQPLKLSEPLWKLLRKYNLIRSPDEQRIHLFGKSPVAQFTPTLFSSSVHRALMASLALDSRMENIRVSYVQSAHTSIDFLFTAKESLLQINDKWLDFQSIHETASCHVSSLIAGSSFVSDVFVCNHIVDDLYGLVLVDIAASLNLTKDESMSFVRKLRHAARDMLQQMPRKIESIQTEAHELQISWTDWDTGLIFNEYRMNVKYSVQLHQKSTCPHYKCFFQGLHGYIPDEPLPSTLSCSCAREIVSDGLTKAIFKNLDPQEDYLPAVARASAKAFIAFHPHPIKLQPLPAPPAPMEATMARALRLAGEQEDNIWKQWREQHFPKIFSNFNSTREINPGNGSCISSLPCPNLHFTFTAGEYSQIRLKSEDDSNEQKFEYIIFLHDFDFDEEADGINRYRLVVSKYSFLKSSTPFNPCHNKSEATKSLSDRELLLHFQDFSTMGQRQDAEIMHISDISHVKNVEAHSNSSSDTVEHISQLAQDVSMYNFFCRFAIYASPDSETSCLTPVGSNLLPHRNRWKRPSYKCSSSPTVFDMSPHILGPSEGFSQASCDIHAALDFNPNIDATWKIRHHKSLVYDGSPGAVLADISASRLAAPELSGPSVPKIALISSPNFPFLLGTQPNDPKDTTKLPLARAMETLKAIATSTGPWPGPFDFIVLIMPLTILHEHFYTFFLNNILILLMRKYSVHFKLVHFADYAVPQVRDALILLASPVCAEAPWPGKVDSLQTAYDVIRDLASKNPRSSEGNDLPGFVGKYNPSPLSSQATTTLSHSIYNHQSATLLGSGLPMDLNTKAAEVFGRRCPKTLHPDRGDNVTIRELARLQGFPDDFIFFGSLSEQTKSICQAFPPPIAKFVAETILCIIRKYQVAPVDVPRGNPEPNHAARPYKRPRVDDGSE